MTLHIAYTIDIQGMGAGQFVDQLLCSVYSLRENKRDADSITCHVLYANMPTELMRRLVSLQTETFKVHLFGIPQADLQYMQMFTRHNPGAVQRSWGGIVYARLFIPKYLPDVDRVIYLDADTLVMSSLHELYETDLKGNLLGMNMGVVPEYGFNSGVILMDLKALREDKDLYVNLDKFMRQFSLDFFLPDQTTINRFFKDKIFPIDRKYNFPPSTGLNDPNAEKAVVFHFYNNGTKPIRFKTDDAGRTLMLWNEILRSADGATQQ